MLELFRIGIILTVSLPIIFGILNYFRYKKFTTKKNALSMSCRTSFSWFVSFIILGIFLGIPIALVNSFSAFQAMTNNSTVFKQDADFIKLSLNIWYVFLVPISFIFIMQVYLHFSSGKYFLTKEQKEVYDLEVKDFKERAVSISNKFKSIFTRKKKS